MQRRRTKKQTKNKTERCEQNKNYVQMTRQKKTIEFKLKYPNSNDPASNVAVR